MFISDTTALVNSPNYDNSFKKLLGCEIGKFCEERNLQGINLFSGNIKKSSLEGLQSFKQYFLLRSQSGIDAFLTTLTEDFLTSNKSNVEVLVNILNGLRKQTKIWEDKITWEFQEMKRINPKSIKIFCYDLYFNYLVQLKTFHNECLTFLKSHNGDVDFQELQYFTRVSESFNENYSKTISPLMTKGEVAEFLGLTPRHVYNLEKAGCFNRVSKSGRPRYLKKDIEDYLGFKKPS